MNTAKNTFPKRIILESTNYCNLRCPSCLTGMRYRNTFGYMAFGLFAKIVDEISQNEETHFISLQGGGEPLLHPQLFHFLSYLNEKKPSIKSQLSTNATLLDKKNAIQVLSSSLKEIIFSVDGYTKETYEKLRKGATYEVVIENILRFLDLKKQFNSKIRTGVCLVRQIENEHETDDFKKFWRDRVDQTLCATYQTYTKLIPDRRVTSDIERVPVKRFPCKQLFRDDCLIVWNGFVFVCCHSLDEELCLGNVENGTIESLFNSEKRWIILKKHLAGDWDQIPCCKNCVQEWSF